MRSLFIHDSDYFGLGSDTFNSGVNDFVTHSRIERMNNKIGPAKEINSKLTTFTHNAACCNNFLPCTPEPRPNGSTNVVYTKRSTCVRLKEFTVNVRMRA